MKNIRLILAVLIASIVFCPVLSAETSAANMLIVSNSRWTSSLAIVAPDGDVSMRTSDCQGYASLTAHVPQGGGALYDDIALRQCSGTTLGVVQLAILAGAPNVWTEAEFREPSGLRSFVRIPPLPAPLARSYSSPISGSVSEYLFEGVRNTASGLSTYIAVIPDRPGRSDVQLTITAYDGSTAEAVEVFAVDGFTFYELKTPVLFGRVVLRHMNTSGIRLFAVAFIGDRSGGSPRVEIPKTRHRAYAE